MSAMLAPAYAARRARVWELPEEDHLIPVAPSRAARRRRPVVWPAAGLLLVAGWLIAGLITGHTGATGDRLVWSGYRPPGGAVALAAGAASPAALSPTVPASSSPPPALTPTPGPGAAPDRSAVAPPTADHSVVAPPSVSAATIDAVLAQWQSPATGLGATFYDLGVQYGIDPAYALAFFVYESGAGTQGVARFTRSIGNIRTSPGYQDYEGYRAYDTWAAGIADWYSLIRDPYVDAWGKRTVADIIPTYAPSGDNNNPAGYIADVTGLVDSWQQK